MVILQGATISTIDIYSFKTFYSKDCTLWFYVETVHWNLGLFNWINFPLMSHLRRQNKKNKAKYNFLYLSSFKLNKKPFWAATFTSVTWLVLQLWGLMCDTWCKLMQVLLSLFHFAYVFFLFFPRRALCIPPLTLAICQLHGRFCSDAFLGSRLIFFHTTQSLGWLMVLCNTTCQYAVLYTECSGCHRWIDLAL